jgi:hypothetical protein
MSGACMDGMRNAFRILVGKLKEGDNLGVKA